MKLATLRRPAVTTVAVLSLGLAFTGCSDDSASDDSSADQTQVVEEETSETPTEEATTEDSAPAADATEVEVGETLEDPDMGDTIEVMSAIRDFPSEEQAEVIEEGGEVVLVQVKLTPGEEYGGRLSQDNFEISWDGEDFWNPKTRLIEEEMDAAGYAPVEDLSRRDGGDSTGWVAFFVEEKADTYQLDYTRRGATVIGSEEEIPEFSEQVEIPSA